MRTTTAAATKAMTTATTGAWQARASETTNPEVIRVAAREVAADVDDHDRGALRDEAARDELPADSLGCLVHAAAKLHAHRHDPPIEGQSPRDVVAVGRGEDLRDGAASGEEAGWNGMG